MKTLRSLLILLMISPLLIYTTGCDDNTTPTPVDSTDENPTVIENRFTAGFEQYDLETDANSTYAFYRKADGLTVINIVGESKSVSGTPIVDGHGEVEIKVKASDVGTFTQANMDDVELEISTGEGVRREEFSWDAESNIVVEITQYDSVGGFIAGTFRGVLKNGINSVTFKDGEFKVERIDDQ